MKASAFSKFYVWFICSCIPALLTAQKLNVDSLINVSSSAKVYNDKATAFKKLAEHYSTNNFDSAILFADAGIKEALKNADNATEGTLISTRGLAFYMKGNYDSAAACYARALQILSRPKDALLKASVLNYIGRLYRKLKDYPKALEMYDEGLAIYTKLNNEEGMSVMYNESGVVYEYKEDYEQALSRYHQSLAICEKNNLTLGASYSLSFIAGVYVIQKKFKQAETALEKALKLRQELGDSLAILFSIVDLADVYAAKKDFTKAEKYYDSSIVLANKYHYTQLIAENYMKLSSMYESQAKHEKSLLFFKKYTSLKDSLLSGEKVALIEELNAKYQTNKKEQLLNEQKADLRIKNYLLWGGSAIFLLLTLSGINIYKKRQVQNSLHLQQAVMKEQNIATQAIIEAEEKERSRIAAELHDGVGQMMSAAKMNLSVFENEWSFNTDHQKTSFQKLISLVDESCKEIRNVSHQMMPNALAKNNLPQAVQDFIDKIDTKVIKVSLYSDGDFGNLDKNVETMLYRVIQECVNNVMKHSGAKHLDISMMKDGDGIDITVEDNGRGFDTEKVLNQNGIGLSNIISRIKFLQGTVDFDSDMSRGTLIAIHVPTSV